MWRQSEDTQLLKLWPDFSASEIAAKLGRSRNAVIGRFHRINKTYSDGVKARLRRRRAATSEKVNARRAQEAAIIAKMNSRIAAGADRDTEIVRAYNTGASQPALGDVFGITRQAISLITKKVEVCRNRESV